MIIFREWAFAAGGVGLMVGTRESVFATLRNSEKVRARFIEGGHVVFVRAGGADPATVRVEVRKGERACLRASASPSAYAKAIVPVVLMASGYHFHLDQVPCPSEDELAQYKDVSVAYR